MGLAIKFLCGKKKYLNPRKKFRNSLNYLQKFAPTDIAYGFHYQKFSKNIFLPIIRTKLREINTSNGGGIVVYLPAYDLKNILDILSLFPQVKWNVFSKEVKEKIIKGSIKYNPINEEHFINAMEQCDGVITNAGFATTSEALFLGKPLLTIPMLGHV